jgi:hypothetical protein
LGPGDEDLAGLAGVSERLAQSVVDAPLDAGVDHRLRRHGLRRRRPAHRHRRTLDELPALALRASARPLQESGDRHPLASNLTCHDQFPALPIG